MFCPFCGWVIVFRPPHSGRSDLHSLDQTLSYVILLLDSRGGGSKCDFEMQIQKGAIMNLQGC